jgi:hypothetical protein
MISDNDNKDFNDGLNIGDEVPLCQEKEDCGCSDDLE